MNNELVAYPSWWKRNWKWAVPLGGCLSLIVIFIMVVGSVFYGVTAALEESQPYEFALETINQGSYTNNNGTKTADMKIPVSGPNGSGILFVQATGEDDDWTYDAIRIEIKDEESIDLLQEELEDF